MSFISSPHSAKNGCRSRSIGSAVAETHCALQEASKALLSLSEELSFSRFGSIDTCSGAAECGSLAPGKAEEQLTALVGLSGFPVVAHGVLICALSFFATPFIELRACREDWAIISRNI